MTSNELEKYLHDHIPLSLAMQVSVITASPDKIVLSAPLAPNINHRETIFGGSASAVAILAAWSLLHTCLVSAGFPSRVVIQRNTMNYDLPIAGSFTASASKPSAEAWEAFIRMFKRKGKARITITAVLEHQGHSAGHLEGEFVALRGSTA